MSFSLFRRLILINRISFSKLCPLNSKCFLTCPTPVLNKKSIAEELGLPEPPSKPQTPFVKFMSIGHKDMPNITWTERVRRLADKWNSQTDEEKSQRLQDYFEEKKEYQLKYQAYLSQLTEKEINSLHYAVEQKKRVKETEQAKREKKKELEKLGKPKHPENCFFLFLSTVIDTEQRSRLEFLTAVSEKWKALPESQRNHFKEESKKRLAVYEREMVAWEHRMISIGRHDLVRKRSAHLLRNPEAHRNAEVINTNEIVGSSEDKNIPGVFLGDDSITTDLSAKSTDVKDETSTRRNVHQTVDIPDLLTPQSPLSQSKNLPVNNSGPSGARRKETLVAIASRYQPRTTGVHRIDLQRAAYVAVPRYDD